MKTAIEPCNDFAAAIGMRSTSDSRRTTRWHHIGLVLLAGATCLPAFAEPVDTAVTFNFNAQTSTQADNTTGMKLATLSNTASGLGATASSSTISTYMTAALHAANLNNSSVVVTGALGTATYVGEGYVWGDSLGSNDGGSFKPSKHGAHTPNPTSGTDGFLINNNFGLYGAAKSNSFTLSFTNFVIDTISYDWEIFPDNTCQSTTCTNLPDMSLTADGKLITAANESALRYTGVSGYVPQAMGTIKNLALGGVSFLSFNDWPAEIGIDNLIITGHTVPEPATLPLLAGGLFGLTWLVRRRKQAIK